MRSKPSATETRNFRTFLLVREFEKKAIGERIATARDENGGMTQQELADAVGVTMRSVQAYEAGDTVPWKHMQKIADVLGRSIPWLIHGGNDRVSQEVAERIEAAAGKLEEAARRLDRSLTSLEEALRLPPEDGRSARSVRKPG
jgi:transcriptional regulator with XRE-family HTH domain